MMFGHFDVSTKYLVKSYIEEHSVIPTASDELSKTIDNDNMLTASPIIKTAGDYVGDFVDKVKKGGDVFSGHIHGHKEIISKGRKFIFVGDPY